MTLATLRLRVGLYKRVSDDASGIGRSPKEQDVELRRYAAGRGWPVVFEETDNDRSASRFATKTRPGWLRTLVAIRAGAFDILLVWEASRLTRDLEEYVELAKACRAGKVKLAYGGNVYDLEDPDDEFRVLLDMGLAQRESGVTRKRILRNVRANAEAGRPHGKRLFGYRRVHDERTGNLIGQEPDPDLAPVVVEIFTRVAAGESMWRLARDLEARGIHPPQAKSGRWAPTSLRNILTNVSYLGHRTHRGAVVVEHAWPAIVDDALFYRVGAVLRDPSRRKSQDVTTVHLLAGLLRCEVCDGRVTYRLGRQRNEQHYRCKQGGCVAVDAARLEAGVRLLIAEALARPDALAVFAPDVPDLAGVRAEHKALTARLDDAYDAQAAGELSARAVGVLERKLTPRIDTLDGMLAVARRDVPDVIVALAEPVTVAEVSALFDALTLEQQRHVIRLLLAGCQLRRAPQRRRREDLGLRFRWAGTGEAVEL